MSCRHVFRDLMFLSLSLLLKNSEEKEITCGSHYTSRAGTISSPNYPDKYSSSSLCVWTVTVNGNNPEIKLKFSEFDLPGKSDGKCSDYVAIYHGLHQVESNLLEKYCGTTLPPTQVMNEDSVRIEFLSDGDGVSGTGFVLAFTASSSSNSITTSQATAGIVAAIFCGIVFIGVATMRCIMMGACQQCQNGQQPEHPRNRECVGTNETISNYVMDCPPSYRTVMEHPEHFPTPTITPYPTPASSPRTSRIGEEDDEGEPPPPYSRVVSSVTGPTAHEVDEQQISRPTNVITVDTHHSLPSHDSLSSHSQQDNDRRTDRLEERQRGPNGPSRNEVTNWNDEMNNGSECNVIQSNESNDHSEQSTSKQEPCSNLHDSINHHLEVWL